MMRETDWKEIQREAKLKQLKRYGRPPKPRITSDYKEAIKAGERKPPKKKDEKYYSSLAKSKKKSVDEILKKYFPDDLID